MQVEVEINVCPTADCGNYYGASSAGNLAGAVNRRTAMQNRADEAPKNWGRVISTRDECPDCRARGHRVRRIPVRVLLDVEEVAPAAA